MAYPGGVESVHFPCEDIELVGVLYPAVGEGPRPSAILLHGIPGAEKNWDIVYRLRELGWHSLILSFRGSWGSGGTYDMTKQPADVSAAVDFLCNTKADWLIDPSKIAVIGYSMGSRAALVAAHTDPRVSAVVSISGIADFDEIMLGDDFFKGASAFLHGTDVAILRRQFAALGGDLNPMTLMPQLKQPILILHGTQDEVVPFYMGQALYEATGKRSTAAWQAIDGADHTYTQQRSALVTSVTAWLTHWVNGGRA